MFVEICNNDILYVLAMITAMDDGVGQIVDTLEASGMADNTIIVFTSDVRILK
jgi:arylsulfatase A-like enzyme